MPDSAVTDEQSALLFEKRGGVAWLTINRPKVRNAINPEVSERMADLLRGLRNDREVKVVVIGGAGGSFCAGGDLNGSADILGDTPQQRTARTREDINRYSFPVARAINDLRQPVIASVRGHAVGMGFMLVAAADLVIASDTAKLCFPYVKLGHTMDHGESFFLLRKMSQGRALQLMLTGETVNAADAERYGLVNWMTADDELDARTQAVADQLAQGATYAIDRVKSILREAPGQTLETQLARELEDVGACAGTDDFKEAITAFFEKRKPVYVGH